MYRVKQFIGMSDLGHVLIISRVAYSSYLQLIVIRYYLQQYTITKISRSGRPICFSAIEYSLDTVLFGGWGLHL
jgi:hypothetical protein